MASLSGKIDAVATYTCEYHWLVELFLPHTSIEGCHVDGNSTGFYLKSVDDELNYETTASAWEAKRFTEQESRDLAPRLFNKLGIFRAIEHGFCGG